MAKTFPATYSAALKSSSINEDWLIQLYYGDESNFIGLAGSDQTVTSIRYYGIIQDFGNLIRRIYLDESRAETDSITITCANKWKNGTLSEILYGGSNAYINRKVKIYSNINKQTSLTNCALIFAGKLVRISHTLENVVLEIEQNRPWDDTMIPYTKSQKGIYAPIAYGDFVQDTEANFYTSKRLYPSPFEYRRTNKLWHIAHDDLSSEAELYFYDKNIDKFIPLTTVDSATTTSGNVELTSTDTDLERTFRFRPNYPGTSNDFTNNADSYDENSDGSSNETTYALYPSSGKHTVTATGSTVQEDYSLTLKAPDPDGKFTAIAVHAEIDVFGDYDDMVFNGGNSNITVYNETLSEGSGFLVVYLSEVFANGEDYTENRPDTTGINILSEYQANNYQLDEIELKAEWTAEYYDGTNESVVGWVRIYDVYLKGTCALDFANEAEASQKVLESLDFLYLGADGFDQSYTGGSGTATEIQEIHRDLMARFCGLDYDDDYMQGVDSDNEYLSENLNTVRSGWTCHWWQLEPRPLSEILLQAQFEGCFIFFLVPDSDGSGNPGGKYVWVQDTYASGDVTATLTDKDYADLNISMVDFKDLITKTTYNYDRHPARDYRMVQVTHTNTTSRAAGGGSTALWASTPNANENHRQYDFEFLTADVVYNSLSHSNPSDCVALYYDNIYGVPRIIIECAIIEYQYFDIEIGDIIQFNDSNINPYGKTWGDLYFMVIEENRSPGYLRIIAREVYEA